jgi:NhaC family Na+:H+ antiporter
VPRDVQRNGFRRPRMGEALFPLVVTMFLVGLSVLKWDVPLHAPLILGTFVTVLFALRLGYRWSDIEGFMLKGFEEAASIFPVMLAIGMVVGVWMISGTIPAMVYYGLKVLKPRIFLVAAFLFSALVSLAMGTTWGTVSSVGVALTAIGQSMGFPLPLTAGAVVSGAFAGATVSPISPMAHLAVTITEVDFTKHARNVFIHSLPALVISIAFYIFMGKPYAGVGADPADALLISKALQGTYNLSPILFLPTILVIGLGFAGWKVVPSLMVGTITGGLVGIIYQGAKVSEVVQAMYSGYLPPNFPLDFWANKGGMVSMYDVLALIIIALTYAGTLDGTGMLEVMMEGALSRFKGQRGLIGFSVVAGSLVGLVAGTQSLAILLMGHTFMESYHSLGIPSLTLSRVLSDCGILVAPLVPWNSNGLFISGVLGVSTFAYAPYAIYCWLVPIMSFIYALRGSPRTEAEGVPKEASEAL